MRVWAWGGRRGGAGKMSGEYPDGGRGSYYGFANPREYWFHGKISRGEAERALVASPSDCCFLVRESLGVGELVLSLMQSGEISHAKILRRPGGYALEGSDNAFRELRELVEHYCMHPIGETFGTLGSVCQKEAAAATRTENMTSCFHQGRSLSTYYKYQNYFCASLC